MTSTALHDPDAALCRAAHRLCRLFRIERAGGFARCSAAAVRRIVARRGALIEGLIEGVTAFERPGSDGPSLALLQALAELADEAQLSRALAEARVVRLQAELELRRGEGRATGLRGAAEGRLLGRG